jgi:hypothetical protein
MGTDSIASLHLSLKKQTELGRLGTDWTAHLVVGKARLKLEASAREDFDDILGAQIVLTIVDVRRAVVV